MVSLSKKIALAIETFLELTDTPDTYAGQAGKYCKVNAGEDALEFASAGAGERTRTIFKGVGEGYSDAALADEAYYAAYTFSPDAWNVWYVNQRLPVDLVALTDVKVIFSNDVAGDNMVFLLRINGGAEGEDQETYDISSGYVTVPINDTDYAMIHEPSIIGVADISGLDKNDIVGFELYRAGTHASDTNTDNANIFGLLLSYTADS